MQAIINGIRYNTESATLIGEATYGNRGDFARWQAGLYVSPRSKRYFLAGEGGPMTQFAYHHPDRSRSGGDRIIPMDRAEAFEWAQHHLTVEAVEAAFGDLIEEA